MRAKLLLTLLVFGLRCSVATAPENLTAATALNAPSNSIYITHVTVIDTETGKEDRDRTVIISGNRILEIKDAAHAKVPAGAKVVDGTGKYLIPGLWDMHVHRMYLDSTYPLYIANGVTGVRDMWGPPDANKFRAELAAKNVDAPHLYLGSPIVDGNPPTIPNMIAVSTPQEARKFVDQQKQNGADFIKVYSGLSREAYFAIIEESRKQNIPVEGHVPDRISAWEATAAKQKSLEHLEAIPLACSTREEELWPKIIAAKSDSESEGLVLEAAHSYSDEKCQRLFAEFKKNGSWPVPTLTVNRSFGMLKDPQFTNDERLRYFGGELQTWLSAKDDPRVKQMTAADFAAEREMFAYDEKLVGAMFRAGIPLLAGTDVGNPYCFPGFSLHDELALLVDSGVNPLDALQAATRNAAMFMDASDKYGSVTPGKVADLVLLDADPLKDIHNTTKISQVFLAGKEFNRAVLNNMLRRAEAAAKEAPVQ
jgi:hypothetical protein